MKEFCSALFSFCNVTKIRIYLDSRSNGNGRINSSEMQLYLRETRKAILSEENSNNISGRWDSEYRKKQRIS